MKIDEIKKLVEAAKNGDESAKKLLSQIEGLIGSVDGEHNTKEHVRNVRPPANKVKVECHKCGKVEERYPNFIVYYTVFDENEKESRVWMCDECIVRRIK